MTIQQELNMKIYFSQHFFFLTFCPWSSLSLTPRSGKRSSLSILSIPTSRCRMWLTIMSPAVSTLSPSLAETLYQEVKPSSRDNLYTSSSVTLLWSVRSLLLARRIVGIFVQKSFNAHTQYNISEFVFPYLLTIRCNDLAVEVLLPPPDGLEGCPPSEVKHHEGCCCVSKEYLQ